MRENDRIRIAIQKSGRLSDKSIELLKKCGLDFDLGGGKDRLFHQCLEFPVDLMLVRDDDIPEYVADGVCDLGIVGENVLLEKNIPVQRLTRLGFGRCRLSLAVPDPVPGSLGWGTQGVQTSLWERLQFFQGKKIATSYPLCLKQFLDRHQVEAQIVEISGAVEIAPQLGIADAICDLISSGITLKSNGLKEVAILFESEATLIQTVQLSQKSQVSVNPSLTSFATSSSASSVIFPAQTQKDINRLLQRIQGVQKAEESKYIMMNAPKESLRQICKMIPGMEEPSVMPLGSDGMRVAIHAVAREEIFWETIEKLKEAGATSILVLPIEKVIA